MASPVSKGDDFRQVLRNRKEQLKAKLNSKYWPNIEKSLTSHHLVEKDECCDIGELICVMTNKKLDWSVDKCIQTFEIIKAIIPKHQSLVDTVITDLKLAESLYPPPVSVESDSSTEEYLQRNVEVMVKKNPELDKRISETTVPYIQANAGQTGGCGPSENVKLKIKRFPKFLAENTRQISDNCCKFIMVIGEYFARFLEKMGNNGMKIRLCVELNKIYESLNKLAQQTSLIDVKKVIREDLLPHMKQIGSIINEIISPQSVATIVGKTLGKSLRFKLIDKDEHRLLCYYEPFLNYILKLVSLLLNLNENFAENIKELRVECENCQENLVKAKRFYESRSVTIQAGLRGSLGTMLYSASAFIIGIIALGSGAGALIIGGFAFASGGTYTAYNLYNLSNTLTSCKEESEKEISELLDKIQISEIGKINGGRKKLCTDSHY